MRAGAGRRRARSTSSRSTCRAIRAASDDYLHAQTTMEAWRQQGVLITRARAGAVGAAAGLHRAGRGAAAAARGFFARVRVEDYGPGRIRPHERTHPGPKEDRLRLTRATRANLSPIFSLFPDPDGAAQEQLDAGDGGRALCHRPRRDTLWRIGDAEAIAALQAALADAELLIADGHHRYETARVYAEEIGGEGEHRYVLMFLCSLSDPGLTVFPTHRLLTGLKDDRQKQVAIRDVLLRDFEVEEVDDRSARGGRHRSATWTRFHKQGYRCTLKDQADRRRRARGQAGALPPARHGGARGARAQGRAQDERRRHRPQERARLLEELRRRRRGGDLGPRRRRLLHARHAGRAGAGGGRGRRVDAAEVHLLLPEGPHRPRVQSARVRSEDLHAQGRRRHHRPLVRRPRAQGLRPPRGLRLGRRGRVGARALPGRPPSAAASSTTTSCASSASCSWPAPSWPPRRRPPSGSSPASRRSPRRWWSGSRPTSTATWSASTCRPKFVIPGGTELSARLDVARGALRRAERRVSELDDVRRRPCSPT